MILLMWTALSIKHKISPKKKSLNLQKGACHMTSSIPSHLVNRPPLGRVQQIYLTALLGMLIL